ncbi:MAG: 7-cyano-7-deazaguanine synthase, partial [Candidatus Thorarchaeota archaeon]
PPGGRVAVCYSGGVDSTIALAWALRKLQYMPHNLVTVTVNYGWCSEKEVAVVKSLQDYLVRHTGTQVELELTKPLVRPNERLPEGYIVPARNAFLASLAARYGDTIWIIANYRKVDDGPGAALDKCRKFFWWMSELLSQAYKRPMRVESPFQHLTKADTMRWFLENCDDAQQVLLKTTTCYSRDRRQCGNCYACAKLALAYMHLGQYVQWVNRFEVPPHTTEVFREAVARERRKGRTPPQELIYWAPDA